MLQELYSRTEGTRGTIHDCVTHLSSRVFDVRTRVKGLLGPWDIDRKQLQLQLQHPQYNDDTQPLQTDEGLTNKTMTRPLEPYDFDLDACHQHSFAQGKHGRHSLYIAL